MLEQYDTPDDVLGDAGDDFVADFVGADRGLKRLDVVPLDRADCHRPRRGARRRHDAPRGPGARLDDAGSGPRAGRARRPARRGAPPLGHRGRRRAATSKVTVGDAAVALDARVGEGHTLKDAFAALLLDDAGWVAVVDADERLLGIVTAEHLHEIARRSAA